MTSHPAQKLFTELCEAFKRAVCTATFAYLQIITHLNLDGSLQRAEADCKLVFTF